jgi:streptomycin 6-kinase
MTFPAEWQLREPILLSDGIGGKVWSAHMPDGTRVIAKLPSALAIADHALGSGFLRWRDGAGAVRLLDQRGHWQLLEHAGERTLLALLDSDGDDAATAIAADVIAAVHAPVAGPLPSDLIALREQFASLFRQRAAGKRHAIIERGRQLAEVLLQGDVSPIPLHGDIHHENILNGPRGWLTIDAKGLIGDAAYDAANMFYNPLESPLRTDTARAARMAQILSARLAIPSRKLLGFGLAHACLSACWHIEDGNTAEADRSLDVAEAILPLLP